MFTDYLLLLFIIGTTIFLTVKWKELTMEAALTGGGLGILIFMGAGFTGIAMMAAFFILGTAASSWKKSFKTAAGIAEANEGQRTSGQVLANAGIPAALGLASFLLPEHTHVLGLMAAAAFSAATADTLASELGNVYGSRYYKITSFKKGERGLDGVVSAEGTLAGIAGSIIIAGIYCTGHVWNIDFLWIVIAGTVGNLADSILGATLENRLINNNVVNLLNTCIASLAAFVLNL